jgi:hypothetical protein
VKPFNAVVVPSRSRPQLPVDAVRADLLQAKALMGTSGVAGFTEISHAPIKALFRSVFGRRSGLSRSDCPIVWTADFAKVDGRVSRGVRGIPVVAPARPINWVRLRRDDGLTLGVVAVHMHPGGWAARPSRAQRAVRPLIRHLWWRHAKKIQRRVLDLVKTCDVVVLMGDINRPDLFTWHPLVRETGPGLLYLGTDCADATVTRSQRVGQHADHPAAVVTITPKEHR